MGAEAKVSLVIPGRNCARTLRPCLTAVAPMMERGVLAEVIFVDDASTDESATLAAECGARVLVAGSQRLASGPGAARNVGWRAAAHSLVWFMDADCVAEPESLTLLVAHLADSRVGGVGGSYGNMETQSLLACLIHEEIVERHLRMPARVTFLGSFNVLYRREVLEQVGGFDERFLKAQDAELSWRILDADYELAFEPRSRVKHFHPVRWLTYLDTQRAQGYWRVLLYRRHRKRAGGDSYSGLIDHVQPPLAVMILASSPLFFLAPWRAVPLVLIVALFLLQWPMTLRIMKRTRRVSQVAYVPMGAIRALWRGIGMVQGMVALCTRRSAVSLQP